MAPRLLYAGAKIMGANGAYVNAAPAVRPWLKLDRAIGSRVRLHGWEKECVEPYAARPGSHDAVEIALVESGVVKYTIGAQEIIVPAGHVIVVPREAAHATTFLTRVRALALWLDADFVAEISDAMGPEVARRVISPGVVPLSGDRVRTLVGILADEVRDGGAGTMRAAEALTESIVIEVLRKAPSVRATSGVRAGARDTRVLAAISRMDASFAEPLTVDDLAKTARMSRFHFSRLFRDEVGQAPYQYLLSVRLSRAAELLRGGHHSVTEAAVASGFGDFSRFSSMFRKHTGKRPTDVLREAREARSA